MAIHDPRTARDYLNDARDHYDATSPGLRWGAAIAAIALIAFLFFGLSATTDNNAPTHVNTEASRSPSPPTR